MSAGPVEKKTSPEKSARTSSALRVWVRVGILVIVALLLWFVVIPQFRAAWGEAQRLTELPVGLIIAATLLELVSLTAYGMLTHSVLPKATRPSLWVTMRVNMVGVATTNAVPAGGAVAAGLRLAMLGGAARSYSGAAGGLMMELPLSAAALGVLFGVGSLFCLPAVPAGGWEVVCAVLVLGIFVGLVLLILMARRRAPIRVLATLTAWLPSSARRQVIVFADRMARSMTAFSRNPGRVAAAGGWAALNWVLDAAALGVFLVAAGFQPSLPQLLLAHGLAAVLMLIPISPGGLGVVEGVLVPTLVAMGASPSAAILGVTGWRLAEYWLPIALGGASAVSLAARSQAPAGSSLGQRLLQFRNAG